MKAYRITQGAEITPLPFIANYRKGDLPAENSRRQAAGEIPRPTPPDLRPARFIRTITLKDGRFTGFASERGSLLAFVISGGLTLTAAGGKSAALVPGDMVLVDEESAARLTAEARDTCRLIQLGVTPDWPGAEAKPQQTGTLTPRGEIKIKRIRKKDDDLSYYSVYPELFSAPANEWSAPRPTGGFRFMCWEDGDFDWHPEVVNNFGIFLSGEIAIEASGDRINHAFRAGDVCSVEDLTGKGHYNRCRGLTYAVLITMETKDLW